MSDLRLQTVAVVGSGTLRQDEPAYQMARRLGRELVDRDFRLITGGRGGVMEAACRGARDADAYTEGRTVGILPGDSPCQANRWVDIALPTGLGIARNALVAHADGVVAVKGGAGTLSEIAMARKLGRPVVALDVGGTSGRMAGRFVVGEANREDDASRIWRAQSALEAAERIQKLLDEKR